MSGVHLYLYDGDPPSWELLKGIVGADDLTYFVANSAIESRRIGEGMRLPRQMPEDSTTVLAFTKAARHLCAQPMVSRTTERILLRRAVEQVASGADLERLKRDSKEWVEALARLRADGLNLASSELTAAAVTPGVARTIREVAAAHQQNLEQSVSAVGFETAVRDWIDMHPSLGEALIMEGFTFLTPLQRHLIDTATTYMDVHLVVPYRVDQTRLFEQVRSTYEPWWEAAIALETPAHAEPDLAAGQYALFATPMPSNAPISLVQHSHVHEEIASIVGSIRGYLDKGVAPSDMVIVTPRRGDYATVLQEEAALQALPVTLGLPPRLLLLTPVGRFILKLYAAFDRGALNLTSDDFEEMLSSGWLGAIAQRSVHEFRAVKNQLFALCRTLESWRDVLARLEANPRGGSGPSRVAGDWVEERELGVWSESIRRVAELTERLFQPGERSIGQHVERLLDTLGELPDAQMLAEERAIIERVKEALAESSASGGLAIRADEFGDVLTSLATEYDEGTTSEDEALARGDRVWVTTPEGVDGIRRPYVFFVGVGADKIPRQVAESWPLLESFTSHQARLERYMFGAVLRAATRAVHLSYAHRVLDDVALPSPLVHLAGIPVKAMAQKAPPEVLSASSESFPVRAVREEYSLTELSHFGLCPYRYKLERLSPQTRRYTSPIHIPHLAQGRWIDSSLRLLEEQGNSFAPGELTGALLESAAAVEEGVRELFPGMSPLDWRAARSRVQREFREMGAFLAQGGHYQVRFEPAPALRRVIERHNRVQFVCIAARHIAVKGIIQLVRLNDLVHEEWLWPPLAARPTALIPAEGGLRLFESKAAAFTWWQETIRNAYAAAATRGRKDVRAGYERSMGLAEAQMGQLIDEIEAGHHPRRPGDHCMSCPVRDECLGLNP